MAFSRDWVYGLIKPSYMILHSSSSCQKSLSCKMQLVWHSLHSRPHPLWQEMLFRPTEALSAGDETVCKYIWGRRPEKSLRAQWCQEHTEGRQMGQCLMKDLKAHFLFTRHQYNSLLGVINTSNQTLLPMCLPSATYDASDVTACNKISQTIPLCSHLYWGSNLTGVSKDPRAVANFSAPWVSSMYVSYV